MRAVPAQPGRPHVPWLRRSHPLLPRVRTCVVDRSATVSGIDGGAAVGGAETLVVELAGARRVPHPASGFAYQRIREVGAFMRRGFQISPHARQRQYAVGESARPVVVTRSDRHEGQSGAASAGASAASGSFGVFQLYGYGTQISHPEKPAVVVPR